MARKREGRAQKEKRGPPGSEAGNVIETHEHAGEFTEWCVSKAAQRLGRADALPFGRLWYGAPNAVSNAIDYAKFRSRSHDAVIRVYDEAGNVIELRPCAWVIRGEIQSLGNTKTKGTQ